MKFIDRLSRRNLAVRDERPVIAVCLGDSVTHGCFDAFVDERGDVGTVYAPAKGYAAQLERKLRALYPVAAGTVVNAGIGGDDAAGGLARLDRDVLSFKPDLVVINFGLNDSMHPNFEEGLEMYRAAMRGMMRRVTESGAECILLTPNFMCRYVSNALPDERIRRIARSAAEIQNAGVLAAYVAAARREAAELCVPVADAYARWHTLSENGVDTTAMLSNFINHPTVEAHAIFVETLMDALLFRAPVKG